MTSEKRINAMAAFLNKGREESDQALSKLAEFTPRLYEAIALVVERINAAGTDLAQVEIEKRSRDKELLIFRWGRRRLIFIPLEGSAWPSPDSNAPHAQVQAARLVVFYQNAGDSTATPVYHFYVFPNGSWTAWGFGQPYHERVIAQTVLVNFALFFLETAILGTHTKWFALKELEYERVSQELRAPMGFAILGND